MIEPCVYAVAYLHHNVPAMLHAGGRHALWVEVENRGTRAWRRQDPQGHTTDLVVYWDGAIATGAQLPCDVVEPGARVTLGVEIRVPESAGAHHLSVDLVEQNVAYFADQGVPRLEVPVEVVAPPSTEGDRLAAQASRQNDWFFWPAQWVTRAGSRYPAFAARAEGCHITDVDGRRYVDYVMGWGSAWLGYAHPIVQAAIRDALDSAAIPTLTHRLEMEVTRVLCAEIPCAQRVLFAKNGSDACTAAARLARVATGRRLILVSGYHGWQDWYLQSGGFASAEAVPPLPDAVVHFRFNDADHLAELLQRYRGRVAAVMLEPAAGIEGLNGPVHEADSAFLTRVAEMAREEGALLIFDEIFTGFRYPGGSVQKAAHVTPDLACFGKALGGGMPLAALVGSDAAFAGLAKIYFGPSFKGEVYSFAAARAALGLYRTKDVVGSVWAHGARLQSAVNLVAQAVGVPARLVGPPVRMVLSFRERDPHRVALMRTLVQQELLKAGVLTYRGFMLASLAHDDDALAETLDAFRRAFEVLAKAARADTFARYLEIPLIT